MAEPKKFSLKKIEQQVIQQQQNAVLSTFISYIAVERLGIDVTPQTRFEMNADFSEVTVIQGEDETPAETGTVGAGGN